jgi:hypothetical protein
MYLAQSPMISEKMHRGKCMYAPAIESSKTEDKFDGKAFRKKFSTLIKGKTEFLPLSWSLPLLVFE